MATILSIYNELINKKNGIRNSWKESEKKEFVRNNIMDIKIHDRQELYRNNVQIPKMASFEKHCRKSRID